MLPLKRNPQDFRDRADNCDELAARATIPEVRVVMSYVASVWRDLADADEAEQRRLGVAFAAADTTMGAPPVKFCPVEMLATEGSSRGRISADLSKITDAALLPRHSLTIPQV